MDESPRQEVDVTAATLEPLPPADIGLDVLFRDHHAMVLSAAYRVTGRAEDAEDVLQTVFLRLVRQDAGSGEARGLQPNPGAYLHRAAVNAALDLLRTRRRSATVPLEPIEPLLAGRPADDPDAVRREQELRAWLRGALGRLRPEAAEVFALQFFEGLANHEIADLLGLSRNAVGVLIHRARKALREDLAAHEGDAR